MSTPQIARLALKLAKTPEVWYVESPITHTNIIQNSRHWTNCLTLLQRDNATVGNAKFQGNKVFLKNIEWQFCVDADVLSRSTFGSGQADFMKPLRLTCMLVRTHFNAEENDTFSSANIVEDISKPLMSRYLPRTNENYKGKYEVLWRRELNLQNLAVDEVIDTMDPNTHYYEPPALVGRALGQAQYILKGSVQLNQTVQAEPDSEKSIGLKFLFMGNASPVSSNIHQCDVTGAARVWYTSN